MTIITHKILGSVECVRSIRTRSIRLVVRADGTLRLSYPILISQKRAIAFAEERAEWIAKSRERMAERRATVVKISRSEVEELRKAAKKELPPLVERLATEYGFKYSSVRISSARTRWGSCSGRNSISLSLFIMLLPEYLREFIVLHELCHTRHHNHSAAFHDLLNSCVAGKESALNRELRRHRTPIIEE